MKSHIGRFYVLGFILLTFSACSSISSRESTENLVIADFGDQDRFFFGIATAPAHSEDQLNDIWLDYARKGKIAAFNNHPRPDERLQFWTHPEVELDLAASSGASVYRVGIDWGRLVPFQPGSSQCGEKCPTGVQNKEALARYRQILQMIRARSMEPIVTLFHHSMPPWAAAMGGFANRAVVDYFLAFVSDVSENLASEVDTWITFNEPVAYLLATHLNGMWPPGKPEGDRAASLAKNLGELGQAFGNVVEAHQRAYEIIKTKDQKKNYNSNEKSLPSRVGLAHIIMTLTAAHPKDTITAKAMAYISRFALPDKIRKHLDFLGLNYYGEEIVKGVSVEIKNGREYSESGRAIYPTGLYRLLKDFHSHYNPVNSSQKIEKLPFMITENGISDSTDILRPSYLIEHLLAIRAAMEEGVPIEGYIAWTISDNWEWLDGYCPKFGFFSVDRNTMQRFPRPSFGLFQSIVQSGKITSTQRENAWSLVTGAVGKDRPFCRASDGKGSLENPALRPFTNYDWSFKP